MRLSKTRQRCERFMTLSTIVVLCTTLIFIYLFYTDGTKNSKVNIPKAYLLQAEKSTDENCVPVCTSKSCIKQAYMLLRSIKPSIDPCENFQKFLCGSYEDKFGRDEGHDMLSDMSDAMLNKLKNLLENLKAEPESAAEKLKILYQSCVDIGSSELRGIEDLRKFLDTIQIYNWPYLDQDFRFSDNGLPILLATLRSYLEINFLGFIVPGFSSHDAVTENNVKVDFNQDIFKNIPIVPKDEVVDILEYFDMEPKDVEILSDDLDIVRNAFLNFSQDGKMYLYECKENCLDVYIDCSIPVEDEWAYVCEMVKVYLNVTNLEQYVRADKITVEKYYVFYVKNLVPRLKLLSDRSVANFFAFRMLWNHFSEINFYFRRKMQKYFKYFGTFENQTSIVSNKWKHCLSWIANGNMKLALENELVKSYLTRTYIDEIHEIHQWHTSILSKMIDDQKWIRPYDKKNIKKHIKNLECNMAFNQRLLPNDTYVNEFSKAFTPTPSSFFLNILNYQRSIIVALSTLKLTHGRKLESKFEASAFTNYQDEIVFHYGFLTPPAYYPGHERFINRIQLAHIVNHEIGHSIYIMLHHILYMSNLADENVFLLKKHCLEEQFSKFKFKFLDENLSGVRYFEENFSDNLGYAVTDKMIEELESTEIFLLPGLPYSLQQLLFMSSRQAWCSKSSRKIEMYFKKIDKHAPSEYRIIASGLNSKRYSRAFNCSRSSYMNPPKKCTVFDSD